MRFAVISDIHSNFPALQAVAKDLETVCPDFVWAAGDFINRGPQPREVLEFLLDKQWPLLRGNHEDYVIAQCEGFAPDDIRANPIWRPAQWTAEQLDRDDGAFRSLPLTTVFDAPSGNRVLDNRILIAHGTPQTNSDGVFGKTTDDELRQMLGDDPPSLFVCAHTHVSLIRQIDKTLVVNVGATGLPFNSDPRAQYGVFTWQNNAWNAELRKVEYDREQTYRAFKTGGFLEDGGPLARVIMHEVETASPHLGPWVRHFADSVRGGHMTVAQATEAYFAMS
jgi:predicted phosphodiesterase